MRFPHLWTCKTRASEGKRRGKKKKRKNDRRERKEGLAATLSSTWYCQREKKGKGKGSPPVRLLTRACVSAVGRGRGGKKRGEEGIGGNTTPITRIHSAIEGEKGGKRKTATIFAEKEQTREERKEEKRKKNQPSLLPVSFP